MAGAIYCLVAIGFCTATDSFWKAVIWPIYLGEVLGAEAKKRGILQ